ncbi:MAG TPA: immunoglobulin domain-containing protein [Candidatus Limnocylindria bacterium]|nr:immunoglobulin domain-containing protein [Candidatus Limnocylindria bacterium]
MKTKQIRRQLASVLACATLTGACAATTYTLTDLGTGTANDINSSGKVVGSDPVTGGWYFDGTNRTTLQFQAYFLGTGPGTGPDFTLKNTLPTAISDTGRIVGISVTPGPPPPDNLYGFFYDVGGTGTIMSPSGQFYPYGVNSSGVIAGSYHLFDGTNLVSLNGELAIGNAVNDSGLVVGSVGSGISKAASFSDGTNAPLNLSALDTSALGAPLSAALSVNSSGQVVGYVTDFKARPNPVPSLAFLYANGSAVSLGTLGGVRASAKDINNSGLIVGTCSLANEQFHAFVYVSGAMADLNSLVSAGGSGWVLTSANAVNDSGAIVGEGTKDGVQHSFLLTPAPENLPPVVNLPPTGTNLFAGESFTLGVAAAGSGPLTYQWQHAGTNIPNATNLTYTVASATANDAGSYLVKVSNAFGTVSSDRATVQVKVLPDLALALYAGITITGPVGQTFRIEAVDHVNDTNWEALGTVTLTTSTFFWVDTDSPQHPGRFYRAVPLP